METTLTKRLDQALKKLYEAYTNNTLHPECACNCATGNVCDNKEMWKHFADTHGTLQLNYVGRVHQSLGRRINGYLPTELLGIEAAFLKGCGYELPLHHKNKKPINPKDIEVQFNGLCAAIDYLCELDAVENVMNIMAVFEKKKSELLFA